MGTLGESVNLGNPENSRRDAKEDNRPKVTGADHPRPPGSSADDLYDDSVVVVAEVRATIVATEPCTAVTPAARADPVDMHSPTVREASVDMVGDTTSHHDPLSGESGTHPVGVGVGAAAGGVAVGAATGFVAGAVAGPLGAAFGTAAGAVIGGIAGGYAGKSVAESINPTTEDHYWRSHFHHRPYVPKNARYQEYEPAYAYGIQMRERLLDQTWEEAEPIIRTGWDQSEYGLVMRWERARPAIMDAWDRLTPEPNDPDGTDEEKIADE